MNIIWLLLGWLDRNIEETPKLQEEFKYIV